MVAVKPIESTSGIYKISIGDHFYYGSAKNLSNRRRQHYGAIKKGVHSNCRMQRAFNKYGTFAFEVIELVEDCADLTVCEQVYLDAHYTHPKCMNLAPVAGNTLGVKHSEESRRNMSMSHIGLQSGVNHPLYGKPRPQSVKNLLSRKLSGRALSSGHVESIRKGQSCPLVRERMAEAKRGHKQSAETIEKRASKLRGADNWKSRPVWIKMPDGSAMEFQTVAQAAGFLEIERARMNKWLLGYAPWPGTGRFTRKPFRKFIGIQGGFKQ